MEKRRESTNANGARAKKNNRPAHKGGRRPAARRRLTAQASVSKPTASPRPVPAARETLAAPKTTLSEDELQALKHLLIKKRHELAGDVDHMENEALRKTRSDASGDLSMMPIHMADIGTDNYEQEFTIGLIENERETLKEIDAALERIENGTYGVCEATHKPISKARLKAKPWARYCVEYKRSQEQNNRH